MVEKVCCNCRSLTVPGCTGFVLQPRVHVHPSQSSIQRHLGVSLTSLRDLAVSEISLLHSCKHLLESCVASSASQEMHSIMCIREKENPFTLVLSKPPILFSLEPRAHARSNSTSGIFPTTYATSNRITPSSPPTWRYTGSHPHSPAILLSFSTEERDESKGSYPITKITEIGLRYSHHSCFLLMRSFLPPPLSLLSYLLPALSLCSNHAKVVACPSSLSAMMTELTYLGHEPADVCISEKALGLTEASQN